MSKDNFWVFTEIIHKSLMVKYLKEIKKIIYVYSFKNKNAFTQNLGKYIENNVHGYFFFVSIFVSI